MARYYIDTSIWLNLFKKEGDSSKGVPYWQIAKEFIEQVMFSDDDEIIYSDIVLREIKLKLGEYEYIKVVDFFFKEPKCVKVDLAADDKIIARQLESQYQFEISFYDLVHMVLCKRSDCILITRDKQLSDVSRENGISAYKPEDITRS
ncbi:tRNA(fMet)-specific endonuclease VapC [uncultured archaeon]|nr:tRNA(fMet)-specific endonuclease VapC [uncultured archaeon]